MESLTTRSKRSPLIYARYLNGGKHKLKPVGIARDFSFDSICRIGYKPNVVKQIIADEVPRENEMLEGIGVTIGGNAKQGRAG